MTGEQREKGAPDGREARPGSTIVIRRTEGVLQTPADDVGWRRKAPALSPDCYRDTHVVPTMDMRREGGGYSGPDARINSLTRSGCTDQRCEEGSFYRQGSSRRRLLAATMEAMGISARRTPLLCAENPMNTMMGLTWCLLNTTRE